MNQERKKCCGKLKKRYLVYAVFVLVVILLNVIAWNSTAFCDAYITYVFPVWVNTYGRFMNLFPFSVGEIMLFAGAGLAVIFIPIGLTAGILKLREWRKERRSRKESREESGKENRKESGKDNRKESGDETGKASFARGRFCRFCFGYTGFFAWLVLIVCVVMTLNCTILYHASTFSEKYFGTSKREYTLEDLLYVRNLVVEKCNELSGQMERDEKGRIVYEGDIRRDAVEAMQKLGETYDQLDGYYPYPKPLATSDFFSQQYMAGYYFPFSMEANYNDVMYIMNKHATMCHELAHLRGYIFEDEANFISYLACTGSDNLVMQYAGYLSVLNYLDNDFYKSIGKDWETYLAQPNILAQVHEDNVFLLEEEWDRIEDKAVLDTETVDQVSDAFTETTLKANGVKDGMVSYSRVVKLLLQYYEALGEI